MAGSLCLKSQTTNVLMKSKSDMKPMTDSAVFMLICMMVGGACAR